MTEGTHRSRVEIEGQVTSLSKSMREANKRIDDLTRALEKSQRAGDQTGKKLDDMERKLKKASIGFSDAKSGALAFSATFTAGIVAMDRASARLLAYQGVMSNAAFSIEKARSSTKGLISDFDLQRLANQALQLQVAKTSERYAELSGAVIKLGRAQGRDAVDSVERMISALGKGETEVLDELGVRLKLSDAYRQYADMLGIAEDKLTDVQKAEAVREVGAAEIIKRSKELTEATDDYAASLQRLKVTAENLGDESLVVAGQSADFVQDAMKRAFRWTGLAGGAAVEFNENLTLGERTAAQIAVAMQQINAQIEAATLAADPMIQAWDAGLAIVDDHLRKYDDSLKLIELSERATRMGQNIIDRERRKAAAAAKRAHAERMRQLKEEFEQMVIVAHHEERLSRFSDLASRGGGLARGRDEARLAAAETGTLQPGEARFENMGRTRPDFAAEQLAVEQERNEILLNEKIRALEAEREAGVDQITLINAEQEALLEHNQFLLDNTNGDIQRMQLQDQRRQIVHDAQMRRIAAERAAEQAKFNDTLLWSRASVDLMGQQTQLAVMVADAAIKNDERRARFQNRARGIQAFGIGALEVVQAAAAAASFNIPGAILHAAAAAVAFTQGGLLVSGRLDQRAGGASLPSVSGASAGLGSAGSAGVNGGQRHEGLVDQINSDVPPSPNPTAPTTASNSNGQQQGGLTFNGDVHLYGTPNDAWLESLRRAQDRYDKNHPGGN